MRDRKVAGAFLKAKGELGVEILADLARAAYKIRVLSPEGVGKFYGITRLCWERVLGGR